MSNTKPQALAVTLKFQVSSQTGEIKTTDLDPLDVMYAYSLLCTGITEVQALELNEAHTKARQRVKTLRETIQWIIEDSRTDSKVKEALTKVLKDV
jgi:hypothetical protein